MIRRALLALPVAAAAFFTLAPAGSGYAQTDPQGPVLVYQNINDGDVLDQLPLLIQLCFAEPINIRDLPDGGDFDFHVIQPDGIGLGHRDIFQPDGWGVAVQPGNPIGETKGEWTFRYRVTTPDGQHATTGEFKYTVDPDGGRPAPRVSPPACVPAGGTATASPPVTEPPTNPPTSTGAAPSLTQAPTGTGPVTSSPVPTRNPGAEDDEDDGGTDVTEIALITAGIVAVLAVLTLIGYFVRRAIGFDPHKPKPGGDDHH
jgi:methionine-rich copper-binding protein CopC